MANRVVQAKLADLRPWDENPRTITEERLESLKRSLEAEREMLDARPLIALADGTVIAGNQRLRAAQELGWQKIPTVYVDLDRARAVEWALRDNQPYGETDDALTAALLRELAAGGRDLDLTGYSSDAIDDLLRTFTPGPAKDPDAAPPIPKRPRSKPGALYELGPHLLMCGDSTDADAVSALLAGETVALLFTDPPYGVSYQTDLSPEEAQRLHRRTDGLEVANDALSADQTRALIVAALKAARAHMGRGASFYVCSPAGDMETSFRLALADADFLLRQEVVWVKDRFAFGRSDYHYRHETLLYGWLPGAHYFVDDRTQDTVWEIARPTRSPEHPTMKPVELVARALGNSSRPGDAVYDPFAGSGTTLIAAERLGRRAFLMELDPGYCDVIRQRYEEYVDG